MQGITGCTPVHSSVRHASLKVARTNSWERAFDSATRSLVEMNRRTAILTQLLAARRSRFDESPELVSAARFFRRSAAAATLLRDLRTPR